jgi:hypothetical protein
MQQFVSLLSWRCLQLNMFRAFSRPSSGAQTAVAASGFTFVSWWQSCCVTICVRNTLLRTLDMQNKNKLPHNLPIAWFLVKKISRNVLYCIFTEAFNVQHCHRPMAEGGKWSSHKHLVVYTKNGCMRRSSGKTSVMEKVKQSDWKSTSTSKDRRMESSQFLCDIAWTSTCLSFHSCNYGNFEVN